MSYSNSFPTQRPSLNLVFNGGSDQLDSRISFSRSDTPPTYAAPSAVHYWSNEKHLSSENLIPYSNDLSQSVWTKRNLTVPATNIAAPDGTSSASSLLETAATGTHDFYEEFTAVSGTSYTFTLYAKANGRDTLHVSPQATSTIASVVFDLTAVTSTVISGSAASHSITAIGSTGWYRLQVTVTATGSGTGFLQTYLKVGGSTSYAGDATKGAYIWGCQVSSLGEQILNSTSGSIHREYSSTLKSVANAGDPRFEYDPTDGQSEGLLIEAQATNYMPNSELDTGYTTYRVTAESSACVGPTGALATVFTETTDSGDHYVADTFSTTLDYSTAYTASVYAKKVASGTTDSRLKLRINGMGGQAYAGFDLVNGTVTQQAGSAIGSAVISAAGNGWYRISMTWTNEAADRPSGIIVAFNNNTASSIASYVGDGFTSYALAGLMVEEGSAPSSLISTSGASASRAADSCSLVSAPLLDNGGGTLYAEARRNGIDTYNGIASVDDGTGSGDIVQIFGNSNNFRAEIASGGTTVANITASGHSAGVYYKHCVSFSSSAAKYYVDGSQKASTDTDLNIPSMSQMHLGMLNAATNGNLNGHIKRVALYNVALSDTELQAITS